MRAARREAAAFVAAGAARAATRRLMVALAGVAVAAAAAADSLGAVENALESRSMWMELRKWIRFKSRGRHQLNIAETGKSGWQRE